MASHRADPGDYFSDGISMADDFTPPMANIPPEYCEKHDEMARVIAENFDGTVVYGHRVILEREPHTFIVVPRGVTPAEKNMRAYR